MNSSNKPDKDTLSNNAPIISEGGVPYTSNSDRDPFEILDDLMTVVEALNPRWPLREPMKEGKYWLL